MIAVKECLCPSHTSQAYNCNVYAPPPEYVNNSEVMQGIVLAAPVSCNEKLCQAKEVFQFSHPPLYKGVHLTFFHSNSRAIFEQRKPSKICFFYPWRCSKPLWEPRMLLGNQYTAGGSEADDTRNPLFLIDKGILAFHQTSENAKLQYKDYYFYK